MGRGKNRSGKYERAPNTRKKCFEKIYSISIALELTLYCILSQFALYRINRTSNKDPKFSGSILRSISGRVFVRTEFVLILLICLGKY